MGRERREGGAEGFGRERERGQWRTEKEVEAEAHGLEKPQVLRGLLYGKDGRVAVDLPNLGAQLVFILTELCFHCWGIFELENYYYRAG